MNSAETLEARLLGRDNVAFGSVILLLCICCTCCICGVVYMWYGVHVVYAVLCVRGVV